MNAPRERRKLGFALLGVIAAMCLLADGLIWWLLQQPMAVRPAGFSLTIDVYVIRQVVWGMIFIQPTILSVYLGYGKQNSVVRIALVGVACLIAYAVNLISWLLAYETTNWSFMRQEGLKEIALLLATQTVGFSLAMWCSRIMRGWHLSSIGDHAAIDERPISKPETIIESTVLALLTIAAIFGPDRFMSGPPPGIGALYFGFNGLVGTLVLAPAVFFALRLQRFRFVGGVLLLLLIAIPAVVLGTMLSVDPDQNSTGQTVYQDLLISTLAAGCTLCAVIASIRLAGFRLVQRKRPKKQVKRAPVDPFSD